MPEKVWLTGLDITASEEQALQRGLELGWELKVAGIRERGMKGHKVPRRALKGYW